jgi:uroporphyrinogen decarboxylase
MGPAREAGCIVHTYSDGDVRALVEDLIAGGVEVINVQDLVNGIEWIAARFAGRVCVDGPTVCVGVDRQSVTRFGTSAEIDALIREEVRQLGRVEGGLMMVYGLYPGVPLENVAALMDAMTRYAGFYS